MDRAKDGLAVIRQSAKEGHNGPCALRIKTGGRLVKEEQQLRFGGKFDTDSGTFLVLDAQRSNGSVGVISQATHLEAPVDAG